MKRYAVNCLCLSELNLDTQQPLVKNSLHTLCRHLLHHSRLSVSSSTVPSSTTLKPGGTLLLTLENTSGGVVATGSDPLGRWCYQTLSGKNNHRITIISAYQVRTTTTAPLSPTLASHTLPVSSRIASLTAHAQQSSLLRQANRDISPHQPFITDLTAFIQHQHLNDIGIFLTGDFNDALSSHLSGMTKLCSDTGLTDLMFHLTCQDDFATYFRGSTRLDYVLCDNWIAASAVIGCYELFHYQTKGDHQNKCIDFDIQQLFGNPTHKLATLSQREFSSTNLPNCRKYIDAKYDYLDHHHFSTRLHNAALVWDPVVAEQLDRDFQRASHYAAKQVQRRPNVSYITTLANLWKGKNVLLRVIAQTKTTQNLSDVIAFQVRHGHSFTLPSTLEGCQSRCRAVQREIHQLERDHVTHRRNEQTKMMETACSQGNLKQACIIQQKIAAEITKTM